MTPREALGLFGQFYARRRPVEDLLARFSGEAGVSENARCAMFNLLLLGSQDAGDLLIVGEFVRVTT
jgi:hypothetical protein